MPPIWLQTLAAVYVPLSIAAAVLVLSDILVSGRRQPMKIMEAVWPLTILYWGPAGLLFYFWFGRGKPQHNHEGGGPKNLPMWQATFNGSAHCGAGCALGDFIGGWLSFALGFTLLGSEMGGEYLLTFMLAYLLGIFFQYFAIAPMRGLSLRDGLTAAVKIDSLSLIAYEIGMFAWMGFTSMLYAHLHPVTLAYWLMMQVAMVLGFATAYPVNWWLIRRGVKERM